LLEAGREGIILTIELSIPLTYMTTRIEPYLKDVSEDVRRHVAGTRRKEAIAVWNQRRV